MYKFLKFVLLELFAEMKKTFCDILQRRDFRKYIFNLNVIFKIIIEPNS